MRTPALMIATGSASFIRTIAHPSDVLPKSNANRYLSAPMFFPPKMMMNS
jgi:hypothetical protein